MNEVHAYFMNPDWMVGICNEERGGEEDRSERGNPSFSLELDFIQNSITRILLLSLA